MLDKVSERKPDRGVHVDVVAVSDELVVDHLGGHTAGWVPADNYEHAQGPRDSAWM
jgi:hypothetical protein